MRSFHSGTASLVDGRSLMYLAKWVDMMLPSETDEIAFTLDRDLVR
jgi:hypothetical protein